jgi:hypothetical protein
VSLPVSAGVWAAAAAPGPVVPPESTQQAIGCPSLFLLVLVGALVPVVPTGALVSSAAVVAFHQAAPFSLGLVFVTASLAAWDAVAGWVAVAGGDPVAGAGRCAGFGAGEAGRARGCGAGVVPAGAGGSDSGDVGLSDG